MKNKRNSVKKPRIGFLDLSFELKEGVLDNGIRPHGGYRGCKKHPPTPMSFDKNKDYEKRITEDVNKLIAAESPTPFWSLELNRQISHSGELPLFVHRLLSPSKVDLEKMRLSRFKSRTPMSTDGVMYYRPNRTHQFLTMTDLRDQTQNEVNLKYGRPTRTTLLRARQRTSSPPVNAYEMRREMMKKLEDMKNNCLNMRAKVLHSTEDTDGETEHYFLTGARYNRAHCVDIKSLTNYGVYMPRGNPLACFITGPTKMRDSWELPVAPPESPVSDVDDTSAPLETRQRPTTAPGYGRRLTPVAENPRQAWADKNVNHNISEEFVNLPNGVRVPANRVPLKRTYSPPKYDDSVLPSVQGVSLPRKPKPREVSDDMTCGMQPPPSLLITSSKEDLSISKYLEPVETKKEEKPCKPKPILVDRAVNIPSVTSESGKWKDEPFITVSAIGPKVQCPTPKASKEGSEKRNASAETEEFNKLNLKDLDEDMKSEGKESEEDREIGRKRESNDDRLSAKQVTFADEELLAVKEDSPSPSDHTPVPPSPSDHTPPVPPSPVPPSPEVPASPIKVRVEFLSSVSSEKTSVHGDDTEGGEAKADDVSSSVNTFFITEEKDGVEGDDNFSQNAPLNTELNSGS